MRTELEYSYILKEQPTTPATPSMIEVFSREKQTPIEALVPHHEPEQSFASRSGWGPVKLHLTHRPGSPRRR